LINRIIFQFYFQTFRILSRIFRPKPIALEDERFEKILVFSAAGIGDTLTDSVAIRAIKETYPKSRVIVVTHRRRAMLAQHNPFADEVILYHKSFIQFIFLALTLRAKHPNVIIMLRGNDPDLWPLAYLINRHAIVSCPIMTRFDFLISHPVDIPDWDNTHGVEQTLAIVRTIKAQTSDPTLVYQVTSNEIISISQKLNELRNNNFPIVVFQLGGGRRSSWRDWPVEYYAELAKLLTSTYKVQLILLGGPDLRPKANALLPLVSRDVLDFVGKLKLTESAALLTEAKILVSTDTGIMHLGFAVGTDTLALIHCHNPASRVGPYGYGDKNPVAQLEAPAGCPPSKSVDQSLLK
jgi:ADP-heptose:LPS heptosyltransferase